MKKGLSAKILLIPGSIIVFIILFFLISSIDLRDSQVFFGLINGENKYREDQTYLTSVMKTKLPETPLTEVKYPITGYRIPSLGGFCWLESGSGLAKYLEQDIDFDTYVFYGNPTLIMAGRNKNERWGAGLNQIHAFTQLGYTAFMGSTSLNRFPQSVYPDIAPRNFIYFKNAQEELVFMKRLISANIIPTINYDGDFSTIVGYNKDGVWMVKSDPDQVDRDPKTGKPRNFMTYPVSYNPGFFTHKELFGKWKTRNQFLWYEKTGQRKPENEVYLENKKNAQESVQTMKTVINYLKNQGNLIDFTYGIDIPSSISLYRYFNKRGNTNLANVYFEIAKIYDSQRVAHESNPQEFYSKYMIETLTKVQPLYEKAASMWP